MVSQEAVFILIYDAATSLIPTDELTKEQLEKLGNITIHGCRCRICRKGEIMGHADKERLEIRWSKPYFSELLARKFSLSVTLFLAVSITLHEIVHILFPEYDEEETIQKTYNLLKRNLWLENYQELNRLSKSELTRLGYSLKK